eukprot:COSAG01_NODE_6_length_54687_cov_500.907599_13_plen_100_part_00
MPEINNFSMDNHVNSIGKPSDHDADINNGQGFEAMLRESMEQHLVADAPAPLSPAKFEERHALSIQVLQNTEASEASQIDEINKILNDPEGFASLSPAA